MKRLLLIPYAFVLMNWAAMRALFCFLRRRRLASLWLDAAAVAPSSAATSWLAEEVLDDVPGTRASARELRSGSRG